MNIKKIEFKMPGWKWTGIFFVIIITGLTADLWTKAKALEFLLSRGSYEYEVISGFFNLVWRENPGAAWSLFAGKRFFLTAISLTALTAVFIGFLGGVFTRSISRIAAALFTAGVMGNFYDRLFNDGRVRDFLDFYYGSYHWPAFNLADSMLCIAVGLIVIQSFLENRRSSKTS